MSANKYCIECYLDCITRFKIIISNNIHIRIIQTVDAWQFFFAELREEKDVFLLGTQKIRDGIWCEFRKWIHLFLSHSYTTAVLTFLLFDILDTTAFYAYNPCQIGQETCIFCDLNVSFILFHFLKGYDKNQYWMLYLFYHKNCWYV